MRNLAGADSSADFLPRRRDRVGKVIPDDFQEAETSLSEVKQHCDDIFVGIKPDRQVELTDSP